MFERLIYVEKATLRKGTIIDTCFDTFEQGLNKLSIQMNMRRGEKIL